MSLHFIDQRFIIFHTFCVVIKTSPFRRVLLPFRWNCWVVNAKMRALHLIERGWKRVKRKNIKFRLTSVAQKRLCLSSLLTRKNAPKFISKQKFRWVKHIFLVRFRRVFNRFYAEIWRCCPIIKPKICRGNFYFLLLSKVVTILVKRMHVLSKLIV